MKVKIGPYKSWFGPYHLAELLCFWVKPKPDENGFPTKPDWVHEFGEFLAHGSVKKHDPTEPRRFSDDRPTTWLFKLLTWIDSKRTRTINVKIHDYDVWNMDATLAHIIVPMLKRIKETNHGAPAVDPKDVPTELRQKRKKNKKTDHDDVDDLFFARWDWVLDEMIFAFEHVIDENWEDEFYSGRVDWMSVPCAWDDKGKPTMYKMEHGPDDTFKVDRDGLAAVHKRIDNGLRLFGKYYKSLWT